MARYTTAYSSFLVRIGEVENLRKVAALRERQDAILHGAHVNALCRGAIVLLSAHLEAYIKELGETALEAIVNKGVDRSKVNLRLFYHISKETIAGIKDTESHEGLATKVFAFIAGESSYWSQTGPFASPIPVEAFNKGFSNPGYIKIKKYFSRFGFDDYQSVLLAKLAANYQPITNMVDHMVGMRNKIAHGDPSATKTPAEIKDMIALIRRFSCATDSAFSDWCSGNLCKIR